jgi:HPt (histidine-containing phosphotransfer) domain-containing protein
MTAHAMKGDRERCLAAGMDGYVAKPIQMKELLESIERVLGLVVGEAPSVFPSTKKLPFDRPAALALVGGELEILQHLVRSFRGDSEALLGQIEQTLEDNDQNRLQAAAHCMKRSLSGLCAQPAVEAALQIETCARQGELARVPKMLRQLRDELQRLEPCWDALLAEPTESTAT